MKEMLELRQRLKKKKPRFTRQDCHKVKRIEKSWRKPRGKDTKIGQQLKGYKRIVKAGWGSPGLVKGLHKSGLKSRLVSSEKELSGIEPKSEGIVIASKVGMRKKILIVDGAIKNNIRILNIKDAQKFLDETQKKLKAKKEKKEKIKKEKKEKKVDKPKKSIDDKIETDKEKKDREKKEKDKLLIKPGKK